MEGVTKRRTGLYDGSGREIIMLEKATDLVAQSDVRYLISNVEGQTWFGPGQPMAPQAPPQDKARAFDYSPSINIQYQPRAQESCTFWELKALADNCDIVRLLIERRKDQIEGQNWDFRPKKLLDGTHPKASDFKAEIEAVKLLMQSPDKEQDFAQWTRQLDEQLLVIDAVSIYVRPDNAGRPYSFEVLDGETIVPRVDKYGRQPAVPDVAFQQIIRGIPAWDFSAQELIYYPRNRRPGHLYGQSPVEQMILTVNIIMNRNLHQIAYYTNSNLNDSLFTAPAGWTSDQITGWQKYWDSMFQGNVTNRRLGMWVPNDVKHIALTQPVLKDAYDEFLARVACFAFGQPPQPFVSQTNRSIGETQKEQALEEGLFPIINYHKRIFDKVISIAGYPMIECVCDQDVEIEPKTQDDIDKQDTEGGLKTINEVRTSRGWEPSSDPAADKLMVRTPTGFVPIGVNVEGSEDYKEPPPPPAPFGGDAPKIDPKTGKPVEEKDPKAGGAAEKVAGHFQKEGSAVLKTLYVSRPLTSECEKSFRAWAKEVGFPSAIEDLHVTIAFSKTKIDWGKVEPQDSIDQYHNADDGKRVLAPLGDKGAVVLKFNSAELSKRWSQFNDAGCKWDYPSYQPHVTVTYEGGDVDLSKIEPFTGDLEFGPEVWAQVDTDWSKKVIEKSSRRFTVPKQNRVAAGAKIAIKKAFIASFRKNKTIAVETVRNQQAKKAGNKSRARLIADGLDLSKPNVTDDLWSAAAEGGRSAAVQLGADASGMFGKIDTRAGVWAKDHSAELVAGVDDTTRERVATAIEDGLEKSLSWDDIASLVSESTAFDDDRAELIANAEIGNAHSAGALEGYREARDSTGLKLKKVWLLGPSACEDCQANADQGAIDLDDEFESGDDAPLAHPGCECALAVDTGEDDEE